MVWIMGGGDCEGDGVVKMAGGMGLARDKKAGGEDRLAREEGEKRGF